MKKRRTLIISLLLVAALALGIGYAGFSIDMLVNGTATMKGEAPNVVFSKAVVKSATNDEIEERAGIGTVGGASIDIDSAGFASVNDELVITLTIKNNHNFDVKVSAPTVELTKVNNEDYFAVSTDWGTTEKTIAANGEVSFNLTIKQVKDTSDEVTQSYLVKFVATQGSLTGAQAES